MADNRESNLNFQRRLTQFTRVSGKMDSPLLRDKPLECEVSVYSNSENVIVVWLLN
jgi:hypothetical protein